MKIKTESLSLFYFCCCYFFYFFPDWFNMLNQFHDYFVLFDRIMIMEIIKKEREKQKKKKQEIGFDCKY